jgi:hypothetical protein
MNKKICSTAEEAKEMLTNLTKEGKFVTVIPAPDGVSYQVQWMDDKTYIAQDGKVYPDEVWITKDGEMLFIQDLSEEHAKNIIRMIMRQERAMIIEEEKLRNKILDQIKNIGGLGTGEQMEVSAEPETQFDPNPSVDFDIKIPQKRTLH